MRQLVEDFRLLLAPDLDAVGVALIVEVLPLGTLRAEVDVVGVGEELIEFLFVGSVGSIDLAIEVVRFQP